jgi:hypothetical protein
MRTPMTRRMKKADITAAIANRKIRKKQRGIHEELHEYNKNWR